jgi:hypothetical protein
MTRGDILLNVGIRDEEEGAQVTALRGILSLL